MQLAPGMRVGPYDIIATLGAGGMGEVYKARDGKLGRFIAVKVLRASRATAADRDRFQREARAVAALSHPSIVTIHSIEEHDGWPLLTMELVEGRPLSTLIPAHGMTLPALLQIAIPLADAVAAAHARGIAHRDLKPGNVMVTDDGRLKVLDFGLAKLTAPAGDRTSAPTEQFTMPGAIVGTAAYMSPEQAEGAEVDHRTDIFSLGVVLFELATGQTPFRGESTAAMLASILRDTPAALDALNPAMPHDLAQLVRRCLEKVPAHRPQSAADLKSALEDVQRGLTAGAPPVPTAVAAAASRWRLIAPAAIAAVVLALALVGWSRFGPAPTAPAITGSDPRTPVASVTFENRTGDTALDPIGALAADAVRQELPALVEFVRQADVGSGFVPLQQQRAARLLEQHGTVQGAYYLDGSNLRLQASLRGADGAVLHAIEPAVGPRSDPGTVVEVMKDRLLGAIVVWLDPTIRLVPTLTRPPLYRAYREYRAGFSLFSDDPRQAAPYGARAVAIDPGFFDAYYMQALSWSNAGDRRRADEIIARMGTLRERWTPKEQALLDFLEEASAGRLRQALVALRKAETLDPGDLSVNYLVGYYLVRLNQPQASLDEYGKVDASAWDGVTIGTWRYARMVTANHLLGRHDEELRIAQVARTHFPADLDARALEVLALAALGRVDDLTRALDEIATLTPGPVNTAGQVMRAVADELRFHGRRDDGLVVARRAVAWHQGRPADTMATPAHRFALAQSLYAAEEWSEAAAVAAALTTEQPANAAFATLSGAIAARRGDRAQARRQAAVLAELPSQPDGLVELRRAQLAALLGERERAVELLRDAFARGLSMGTVVHRAMDFESLRGFAPFDELMKPKG